MARLCFRLSTRSLQVFSYSPDVQELLNQVLGCFQRNCSICSCRSSVSMEEEEFRILLCHHLEPDPVTSSFFKVRFIEFEVTYNNYIYLKCAVWQTLTNETIIIIKIISITPKLSCASLQSLSPKSCFFHPWATTNIYVTNHYF